MDDPDSHCANEARLHDHDRYLCAIMAPSGARPALLALAAFNIETARVAESVSEPLLGQIRLEWWREAVADLYDGKTRDHPVLQALAPAVERSHLSRDRFDRIIEARKKELNAEAPADVAGLEDFARATSGELHQLWREALGETSDGGVQAVDHAGIAFALAGLVRAIPFHASQGRLYLPADLVRESGLDQSDVFAGRFTPELGRVVLQILNRAEPHIRDARNLRRDLPRRAAAALLPVTLAAMYVRRLRKAGGNPFAAGLTIGPLRRQLRLTAASILRRY